VASISEIPLGAGMTAEQARVIFRAGEEAVIFALLEQAKMLARQQAGAATPATPSGMTPGYAKTPAKARSKAPGREKGHPGSRRAPPERIDRREEHRLERCPDCGGKLKRCQTTRTRYIEDIPADLKAEVVEHTIHRDWCPQCKKRVEPAVPDALPNSTLGHRVLAHSAWLHYALGNTLSQII